MQNQPESPRHFGGQQPLNFIQSIQSIKSEPDAPDTVEPEVTENPENNSAGDSDLEMMEMTVEPDILGVMMSGATDSSSMCPLCQETFQTRPALEQHVMCVHSVNADGLNRLLQLCDQSHWMSRPEPPPAPVEPRVGHRNQSQQNQVISERHVYKFRCALCSLAFKTQDKLAAHALYHQMRDATKCSICGRSFRSAASLQRHMGEAHGADVKSDEERSSACSGGATDEMEEEDFQNLVCERIFNYFFCWIK